MGASDALGSRRARLVRDVVATASLLVGVEGCDALLGLGDFQQVPCAIDCDGEAPDAGPEPVSMDTGVDQTVVEASVDDVLDASPVDVVEDEGSIVEDVPAPPESGPRAVWPHWAMPNPEASIGGDATAALPHPMTYEGGAEASVVRDAVTGLLWQRWDAPAADIESARAACGAIGPGWRVPARIELVSLIDFTRAPTIDTTTFVLEAGSTAWTSSPVAVDASADAQPFWTVSFATGIVDRGPQAATAVRCVWSNP
ncbi:MAG TPA: DUF1566 domain-containing protein [Polyangiaceae bacterium]|nr:DUF1566 domain-containing protein [Polyangiaceae bacterium]